MRGTWAEIVRAALLKIGVIDSGEDGPDSDEQNDVFQSCKDMLEEWALEGLLIPGVYSSTHIFKTESDRVTIGPAEFNPDIVQERPYEEIYTLNYILAGDEYPRRVKNTTLAVVDKEKRSYSYYPKFFFYNQTYPVYEIVFESLTYIGDRIVINGRGHFTEFALDDPISNILPLGYRKAIINNLAVIIAADYGNKEGRSGISAITVNEARRGKSIIRNRNHTSSEAPIDPALRDYGYLSGVGGERGYRR